MSAPNFLTESGLAGAFPAIRFNKRERQLLASVFNSISPSHVVKFAGTYTTLGGSATESIPAVGIQAGDIVHVTLRVKGATPRTILTAIPGSGVITVTMSGDASTDHVLQYMVLRVTA